ncbi:hypothetical protein [Pigmentiphaga kullae]|uniref:Uncharacterized protein n=1 Tax=Pigmentiphaga kullae TaxID=151784 RepID=A0A4Q7NH75_9BURK|nr:hypothetical protein [Pigmentiphaga kullae]RZS84219.1 hypothetical protein EV675_0225 [Pigmentiphaga kullae]
MNVEISPALVINAPEFFADPDFQSWLNNSDRKFTWHRNGAPDEWSDTVVMVDPGLTGAGSDSDMPEAIWDQIVSTCRLHIAPRRGVPHVMVRLTNMQ